MQNPLFNIIASYLCLYPFFGTSRNKCECVYVFVCIHCVCTLYYIIEFQIFAQKNNYKVKFQYGFTWRLLLSSCWWWLVLASRLRSITRLTPRGWTVSWLTPGGWTISLRRSLPISGRRWSISCGRSSVTRLTRRRSSVTGLTRRGRSAVAWISPRGAVTLLRGLRRITST